ncbi:MAG: VWA domain-containing protein [Polyangia bacterium]
MTLLGLGPVWVGVLAALGVVASVLLYLRQWGRRRVVVAFSPLWKRVLAEADVGTRRRRVLELLSLVLQVAVVLLLVLALGRPLVGRKPSVQVIVIDTSASMLARRQPRGDRLSAAKQKALELMDRVSDADEVALVTSGGEPRLLSAPTRDHYSVRSRIVQLEGCACEGRLREAVNIAHALVTDPHQISVFTDGDEALDEAEEARVLSFGKAASNIGITLLGARAAPANPGRYDVLLEIRSFAATKAHAQLRVTVDGQLVQLDDVRLEPGERKIVALPTLVQERGVGLLKAELYNIEIEGAIDALAQDDVGYTLLAPEAEYPVRLYTDSPSGRYVREVLRANPRYRVVDIDRGQSQEAAGSITVLVGEAAPKLPGRYLVLGAAAADRKPLADAMFTDWRSDHPILKQVSLLDIVIKAGSAGDAPEGAQVLGRFGEVPLLYVSQRSDRTEVGITFDLSDSNLPLRVAFPVLVYNAIDWMLGSDELEAARSLGRRWHIERVGGGPVKKLSVTGPSPHVEATAQGSVIVVDGANAAGLYEIRADDETFRVAASLTSSHESDLRTVTKGNGNTSTLPRASDLWSWLVYAAFGVLVLEWFLYHRRITS